MEESFSKKAKAHTASLKRKTSLNFKVNLTLLDKREDEQDITIKVRLFLKVQLVLSYSIIVI